MAKKTVEECFVLDVFALGREGVLHPGRNTRITFSQGEHRVAQVYVRSGEKQLDVRLLKTQYLASVSHAPVALMRTLTAFGAKRVQFICPRCLKSCGKLYLPPKEAEFLCRSCHDLTYKSRQRPSPRQVEEATKRQLDRLGRQAQLFLKEMEEGRKRQAALRKRLTRKGIIFDDDEPSKSEVVPAPLRPRGRPKEKRPYLRTRPFLTTTRGSEDEHLCVKCRDWRTPANPQPVILGNGRAALRGTCPVCGSTMVRIVKASS